MQAPVLVFDHVNKKTVVLVGAKADKHLADLAAAQTKQLAGKK